MYKYGLGRLQLASHVIKQVSEKAGHGQDTDMDANLDMDTIGSGGHGPLPIITAVCKQD